MIIRFLITIITLSLVVTNKCLAKAKDTLNVTLFYTSLDLYHDKPVDVVALVITDELSSNYFYANKIIDKKTGKKVKDSKFIWAIKYNNGVYVNMGYMDVMTTVGMYIKLDIVGTYGALIYDERMPYKRALGAMAYGGGIIGHVASKSGGNVGDKQLWKVSDKNSVTILFCNLLQKEYRNFQMSRNESCILTFISRKDLKKVREQFSDLALSSDPSADEVLNFFDRLNSLLRNK